jgi:hypothetical protein
LKDTPIDTEQRLDNHEKRITELERNQYEMKNGMLRIENTVLQQGKEQKDMLSKFIDHFFADRKDVRQTRTKLSEIRWQTVAALLGGGGAIALIVQWLVNNL